ncbi:MAG: FAD-dependent oxidoreductase [Planctomycetota bacterium]|nr:FAD-dependent oxidoreductase [Planctomycetota bacterium]
MSTRTGGYTLLQFLFDFSLRPGTYLDRVLNGPTSDVWIQPWLTYLEQLGVRWMANTRATDLEFKSSRIASVGVVRNGIRERLMADYYLLCLPVESIAQLVTPTMCTFDPRLANLSRLQTSWMCGVIFYLRRDVPIVHGHTNYVDSPWALTSISQPQFWQSQYSPCRYGNGEIRGILSVIVSSWDTPGIKTSKTARECTPSQLTAEIWGQLKAHLNNPGVPVLQDEDVVQAFIAPSLQYDSHSGWTNQEPLFINTVGSWDYRPDADTKIENMFLAGDYVRTNTDVATMESANEAARRAVNAILRLGSDSHSPCDIWERDEPHVFSPLRKVDDLRYRQGSPPETTELEAVCLPPDEDFL